jgi:splicing factor 3B subunit 3
MVFKGKHGMHPQSLFFSHRLQAVLDGDLIEQFNTMALSKRKEVAEELERTPQEVSKKLEDMRARYAF